MVDAAFRQGVITEIDGRSGARFDVLRGDGNGNAIYERLSATRAALGVSV
jgi:hypothetical protein